MFLSVFEKVVILISNPTSAYIILGIFLICFIITTFVFIWCLYLNNNNEANYSVVNSEFPNGIKEISAPLDISSNDYFRINYNNTDLLTENTDEEFDYYNPVVDPPIYQYHSQNVPIYVKK